MATHLVHRAIQSEGFRKYFKNTSWLFLGRFVSLAASFLVGIYVARYLGPAQYGDLNYVISFVGLFAFLATFGADSILNRELIRNPDRKDELLGTGFALKLGGAVLATVCAVSASLFATPEPALRVLILLYSIVYVPQALGIVDTYFQSQVLSRKSVSVQIGATFASAVFKLACVAAGASVAWLIGAYLFEAAVTSAGLLIAYRTSTHRLRLWRFHAPTSKRILRDALPLMLSGAAIGIYSRIDQVLIHSMLGDVSTGLYAVAVKLSEAWYFVPMLLCTSLAPAIMSTEPDSPIFERRLLRLYGFILLISVAIAAAVSIAAGPIVTLLFGTPYAAAVPLVRVYAWAGVSVSLGIAFGLYLLAKNLNGISLFTTLLGAFSNVVLNLLLIPPYGMMGSAIATVISYTLATFGIFAFREPRIHAIRLCTLGRRSRTMDNI